jgi:rSAM/selenodomain-associated transferase 2
LNENPSTPSFSIIIPTLNEEKNLKISVSSVGKRADAEIIVADGGSDDGTLKLAAGLPVKVVEARRGRARQLNAGALESTGEIIIFLHADSVLPLGWDKAVAATFADPRVAGGAFRLKVDSSRILLRLVAFGANLRTLLFHSPFGDQAIFVRRGIWEQMHGYADIPIMEDVEFIRRLKKCGRLKILRLPVTTSPRRWHAEGLLKTTLRNYCIQLAYKAGVPPEWLKLFYR